MTVNIDTSLMESMIHEINSGNKKLEDFGKELGISTKTLRIKLNEAGFIAHKGYNLWSKPGESKEETLERYYAAKRKRTKRLNIELAESKFTRLKVLSAEENKTMTEIVTGLIDERLSRKK